MPTPFPSFTTLMPEAAVAHAGVRGWVSQAPDHQVVFLHFPAGTTAAPHAHGTQWGLVVSGKLRLTAGGVTREYGPGDWHEVPAGVQHSAEFPEETCLINVFADSDRYKTKAGS
ncbi:MAG: cupin domain-containing protein [Gemmatimonadaceae bacterium]